MQRTSLARRARLNRMYGQDTRPKWDDPELDCAAWSHDLGHVIVSSKMKQMNAIVSLNWDNPNMPEFDRDPSYWWRVGSTRSACACGRPVEIHDSKFFCMCAGEEIEL